MRIFMLATTLVGVLATSALGQTSTITNGSFEQLGTDYFPVDWSPVGEGVAVTTEARTGRYALRIHRRQQTPMPPETGLNRRWQPGQGEGSAMLDRLRGVVSVWCRVVSADKDAAMNVVVIPMGASGLEDTGEPRAMRRIPPPEPNGSAWREVKLAYDYSRVPAVKWVHIGIRITGGAADLLVDDFALLDEDKAILSLEKVHLYPDAKQPDAAAMLTASVENIGLAPSGEAKLVLELPEGMVAEGPTAILPVAPGTGRTVRWTVRGPLRGGAIRIHVDDGTSRESATVALAPRVEFVSALAEPSLVAPGRTVKVTGTAWNRGTAVAEGYRVRLTNEAGRVLAEQSLPRIRPGEKSSVLMTLPARGSVGQELRLRCHLVPPGQATAAESWPVTVTLTDAFLARTSLSLGPLTLRTGSDRTVGQLILASGNRARTVGVLPHLGRVTVRLPSGELQTLTARYSLSVPRNRPANLQQSVRDKAGGLWRFQCAVRPLSATAVRLQVSASCTASRQLVAFEGPTLLVGEQATGARKVEAIFPGLEWLEGDEVSSSDLDIAASHPDRPRYAPHPNKVTIPAMVVETTAGTAALYWDMRSRWDGVRDRPQPVFASPDRLAGRAAHLMGLMAPSAAHNWPENGLLAQKPPAVPLNANVTLRLSAVVQVFPAGGTAVEPGALRGVAGWFQWFKPDAPAPAPKGSDLKQIAWSMHAYLTTLWDKDGRGWFPYLLGPSIWRHPTFDPSYAYDLLEASRLVPDDPIAGDVRKRLDEVRERLVPDTGDNVSFAEGDPLIGVRTLLPSVTSLITQQGADGSYGFDADRRDTGVFRGYDYHELGPPGAVELGTIARNAYLILRAARLTGSWDLHNAGVKSLQRMASFRVPRAAQVWEVPVHTPDILAAADAVDAHIEAYRFSGDSLWLVQAQRWAVAGLPFVYVWNAPGKLWMRYGSIPVFGATQYLGSWFGNIVQWNGLRYAAALLRLYRADPQTRYGGLSWRDLAIGITRSAMYQQTDKPEYLALWPDSLHTVTSARAGWEFAPRMILRNVFDYLGRSEEPHTIRLTSTAGQHAYLSSVGTVRDVRWEGTTIRFAVQHPQRMAGSVLIVGVTKPSEVLVGSRRIPEAGDRLRTDEACWRYDDFLRAVAVRIPSDARTEVVIRNVEPSLPSLLPRVARRVDFDFTEDEDGWAPENHIAELKVRDGVLMGVSSGPDPYLTRSNCQIQPDTVSRIIVRIRADGSGAGQFYWVTTEEPYFDENKVLNFTFPADGEWHEVVLEVGNHPRWRGKTITAIRLDPAAAAQVRFAVDYVRGQ